jgi:hypothetical protein
MKTESGKLEWGPEKARMKTESLKMEGLHPRFSRLFVSVFRFHPCFYFRFHPSVFILVTPACHLPRYSTKIR